MNEQVALALKLFAAELAVDKLIIIGAVYDFRNDYKQGYDRLVFTNVNGESDPDKIKRALFSSKGVATK